MAGGNRVIVFLPVFMNTVFNRQVPEDRIPLHQQKNAAAFRSFSLFFYRMSNLLFAFCQGIQVKHDLRQHICAVSEKAGGSRKPHHMGETAFRRIPDRTAHVIIAAVRED